MGNTVLVLPLNFANGERLMPRRIPAKKFIEVWQTSNTLADVAVRVGSKKTACSVRASNLRNRGIPLKSFRTVTTHLDIPTLIEYAQSLTGETND